MNAPSYLLTIRVNGCKPRTLPVPLTLSDALSAARVDAAWLCGIGTVNVSPVPSEAKG